MDTPMQIALLDTGSPEYEAREAAVDIDRLIDSLEQAKDDGITHVALASGNYRGAKYLTLRADWEYA